MKRKKNINFEINGGKVLSGSIVTNVAKNSAVGLLCASLLNKGETILEDMPKIEEVFRIIETLKSIGVDVQWKKGDVHIKSGEVHIDTIDKATASRTRSAIMLIGSLIHLFKQFRIPQAGGCQLGKRPVNPHFDALECLGVKIKTLNDSYDIRHDKLKTNQVIVLSEAGDTVTENIVMAASKIPGKTIIKYASANYQVQDVCRFLEKLGVVIEGIGTTTLIVHGKKEINEKISFRPSEDPIESMLFISLAITTNSELLIKKCPLDFLELELKVLKRMGFRYKFIGKEYFSKNGFTRLIDIQTYPSRKNLKAIPEKIDARPYPGLNIDNLPFFVPIATQSKGQTLIHDWVYENRAIYYLELNKLGANIILADPHRVFVNGPRSLKSTEVICPPALRPAAIILIAMLAANGNSILRNVYSINRGYEDLCRRLQKIGADISISKKS